MIRCQNCGTDNLDTGRYCDECGTRLEPPRMGRWRAPDPQPTGGSARASSSDPLPASPPRKTLASVESSSPSEASLAQPLRASVVDAQPRAGAKLIVIRAGRRTHEFPLLGAQWLIGRWDPDHGIFPDIDLDAHDPEATVSRRHARLLLQDAQFLIEDLGSTNGTFINRGRRLTPGLRYLVQDGDEIIVGKTFLKFKLD